MLFTGPGVSWIKRALNQYLSGLAFSIDPTTKPISGLSGRYTILISWVANRRRSLLDVKCDACLCRAPPTACYISPGFEEGGRGSTMKTHAHILDHTPKINKPRVLFATIACFRSVKYSVSTKF